VQAVNLPLQINRSFTWKTLFHAPESNKEKLVEKKDAESLFRHLLAKENEEDFNAIFILAVMLERKKILIERDVQKTRP